MAGCCPPYQFAAERQFDDKKVAQEVKQYRAHGLGPTTRLLERGIAESRAAIETVLDVGSGIGTLALSLLERGATSAIAVDASSACLKAAREEAERQGRAAAIRFAHGDFVALADRLPPASVVTLDRVVCCYPRYEPLLEESLIHATSVLALSYPRDVWYVRLAVMAENAQRRLRGNPFRAFVHPAARIEQLIRRAGFERSSRRETWMWTVDVYLRRDDNHDSV